MNRSAKHYDERVTYCGAAARPFQMLSNILVNGVQANIDSVSLLAACLVNLNLFTVFYGPYFRGKLLVKNSAKTWICTF